LPALGRLPSKNVRRGFDNELSSYFTTDKSIRIAQRRYKLDLELFYPEQSLDALAHGIMTHEPVAWERFSEPVGSPA
jgi:hypothetical protein